MLNRDAIQVAAQHKPQLIVVIDTEEEFDWNAPVDRKNTGVTAMDYIVRAQDIFDEYGIRPCYVVDYPVASKEEGYRALKKIHADGRCEIGAHLHPWVNPPFDETLCPSNTFPGNLPAELEREKLIALTDKITESFGQRPISYKAGRYGFGPNTQSLLQQLGYEVDLSFCPPVNYQPIHGPDYSQCHASPFWFSDDRQLLEIPVTGDFVGWAGPCKKPIYNIGQRFKQFKLPGILARLGVVDRLMLSPEGFNSAEHIRLVNDLYRRGVRTFTWSFHSPTVVPGHTDYVQNEVQLRDFLDSFRTFFDYFFGTLDGEASSPVQLRDWLRGM